MILKRRQKATIQTEKIRIEYEEVNYLRITQKSLAKKSKDLTFRGLLRKLGEHAVFHFIIKYGLLGIALLLGRILHSWATWPL